MYHRKLHVLAYQQKLRKKPKHLIFSLFRSYATIPAVDQELIFTSVEGWYKHNQVENNNKRTTAGALLFSPPR